MGTAIKTGTKGEDLAADYLLSNGFELLHRNWRSGRYEIDILALKDGRLHVAEVKSRSVTGYTTPEEAMTSRKFGSLVKAAGLFLEESGVNADVSFDLIAVDFYPDGSTDLRYYPDAVYPKW